MEPELRDLLDRHQIYQVLMRYCRAIDRADPQLLQTVYHDGAVAKHWTGEFRDAKRDFVEYAIPRLESFGTVTQHHITNCLIALDGDSASAESYFFALQPTEMEDGSEVLSFIGGRYLDRFERRDGRWAIVERSVVNDWSRLSLSGEEWPPAEAHARGGLREADPSHDLFAGHSFTATAP
jgi:SnoaL-like domain